MRYAKDFTVQQFSLKTKPDKRTEKTQEQKTPLSLRQLCAQNHRFPLWIIQQEQKRKKEREKLREIAKERVLFLR